MVFDNLDLIVFMAKLIKNKTFKINNSLVTYWNWKTLAKTIECHCIFLNTSWFSNVKLI